MCYPNNYWGMQMKERAAVLEMAALFVCNNCSRPSCAEFFHIPRAEIVKYGLRQR